MEKHLHIICHDVPYPVDFGGVFDLYYKLKALSKQGIKIHLHCFVHKRPPQKKLEEFCVEINYYERKSSVRAFPIKLPYIVACRINEKLFHRLLQDEYPILMEGIHTTGLLLDARFQTRKKFVRLHNVEHVYYRNLYSNSNSFLNRIYLRMESKLLAKHELSIANAAPFICVSEKDAEYYKHVLNARQVTQLPLFSGWNRTESITGKGSFCLYHGNLSVPENEAAATWLIEKVFNSLHLPLIIAGKNPSAKLKRVVDKYQDCSLIENPKDDSLRHMISSAQINVLPSFNETGIKLKILHALFHGRHCLVNSTSLTEDHFRKLCEFADGAEEMKKKVRGLFQQEFTDATIARRNEVLEGIYNNEKNAIRLIQSIW